MEKYLDELKRMAYTDYSSHLVRTHLLQAMNDRFDGLIDASLKGENLHEIVQEAIDNFGLQDPKS